MQPNLAAGVDTVAADLVPAAAADTVAADPVPVADDDTVAADLVPAADANIVAVDLDPAAGADTVAADLVPAADADTVAADPDPVADADTVAVDPVPAAGAVVQHHPHIFVEEMGVAVAAELAGTVPVVGEQDSPAFAFAHAQILRQNLPHFDLTRGLEAMSLFLQGYNKLARFEL